MAKTICGARNRRGIPCTQPPTPGKKRCRFHGGWSTGPKTPGNQNATRTRLYSRHLLAGEQSVFEDAAALLGKLDAELCLARTKLDWATAQWSKDRDGGVITRSGKDGATIRPWVQIVSELEDLVRRLEATKAQIAETGAHGSGSGDGFHLHVHGVAGVTLAEACAASRTAPSDSDSEDEP